MNVPVYVLSESESESNPEDEDLDNFFLSDNDILIKPKVSKKTSPTKSKSNEKIQKEKLEMSENRQLKLERKKKMQEEKLKLKADRKKASEKLKQLKPGECMKFIFTYIDSSLVNQKFGGELLTALQSAEIKYTVREQEIPNTISWLRNVDEINESVLNYITVVWIWNELVASISSGTLNSTVRSFVTSHSKDKITIVIFGMEEYFRRQKKNHYCEMKSGISNNQVSTKSKKDNSVQNIPQLSKTDIEMAMGELQLLLNIQYKFVESGDELGLLIAQSTKGIAELPYKLQRNKTQESTDWYAAADTRDSVRVDGNGNGLLRLWQQQICQFPNVGLDVAQAIVSEYKSPRVLMEAYDECTVQRDAELLLQNIPIRRAVGPLTSVRRVGPELSKKICAFFNSTDGNILLN